MAKSKSTSGEFYVLEFLKRSCKFLGCIHAVEHMNVDPLVVIAKEVIIHVIFLFDFWILS